MLACYPCFLLVVGNETFGDSLLKGNQLVPGFSRAPTLSEPRSSSEEARIRVCFPFLFFLCSQSILVGAPSQPKEQRRERAPIAGPRSTNCHLGLDQNQSPPGIGPQVSVHVSFYQGKHPLHIHFFWGYPIFCWGYPMFDNHIHFFSSK